MSQSFSIAVTGAGGAGAVTAGRMLLDAVAASGWYAQLRRSSGPQIRGGESAVMLRISDHPVCGAGDDFDCLLALDWLNVERFIDEIPLRSQCVVLHDPDKGDIPEAISRQNPVSFSLPLKQWAKSIDKGRPNMVAVGVLGELLSLPAAVLTRSVTSVLGAKGAAVVAQAEAAIDLGRTKAREIHTRLPLQTAPDVGNQRRWNISGNEASALGALRGGVRFVAAYPITPASEILEWMAPKLEKLGGTLLQAEDELASINMAIGASYGGTPSYTATSGPGFALMTEGIGMAVASETPVVVQNVMRGGPSTGIPTKSEQSDLNIALHGLHGDAPHLVLAPNSIADCVFTTQWAVHLAETLQTAAVVLSDQAFGQTRAIIDEPPELQLLTQRRVVQAAPDAHYHRYALTADGVSPMAIPGQVGCSYTADGLEHDQGGVPSSKAADHAAQLDKRRDKLERFDYGDAWADIDGDGETLILTWGSSTGAAMEAARRLRNSGLSVRVISMRLLLPTRPERFMAAIKHASRILIVEQSHGRQFYHYLCAYYRLPPECQDNVRVFAQAGPLPVRPGQIERLIHDWR